MWHKKHLYCSFAESNSFFTLKLVFSENFPFYSGGSNGSATTGEIKRSIYDGGGSINAEVRWNLSPTEKFSRIEFSQNPPKVYNITPDRYAGDSSFEHGNQVTTSANASASLEARAMFIDGQLRGTTASSNNSQTHGSFKATTKGEIVRVFITGGQEDCCCLWSRSTIEVYLITKQEESRENTTTPNEPIEAGGGAAAQTSSTFNKDEWEILS